MNKIKTYVCSDIAKVTFIKWDHDTEQAIYTTEIFEDVYDVDWTPHKLVIYCYNGDQFMYRDNEIHSVVFMGVENVIEEEQYE